MQAENVHTMCTLNNDVKNNMAALYTIPNTAHKKINSKMWGKFVKGGFV